MAEDTTEISLELALGAVSFRLNMVGRDILFELCKWLEAPIIGRLYLSGDRFIRYHLVQGGAAHRIHLDYPYETPALFWPNLCHDFTRLTHFAYMRGRVKGSIPFTFTAAKLKLLPPSLTSLWLGGDKAEGCFLLKEGKKKSRAYQILSAKDDQDPERLRQDTASSGSLLDIAEIFPNLRELLLRDTSSSSRTFEDDTISALPRTLQFLSLYWNSTISSNSFAFMPTSIQTLRLGTNSHCTASHLSNLPNTITKVSIPRLVIASEADVASLPPTLLSIRANFSSKLPVEAWALFPQGITKISGLHVQDSNISRLPKSLTRGTLNEAISDWSNLRYLPPQMTRLGLAHKVENSIFDHLPPTVIMLKLKAPQITEDVGPRMPKTLRILQLRPLFYTRNYYEGASVKVTS